MLIICVVTILLLNQKMTIDQDRVTSIIALSSTFLLFDTLCPLFF